MKKFFKVKKNLSNFEKLILELTKKNILELKFS
jgi:hypothetical protein